MADRVTAPGSYGRRIAACIAVCGIAISAHPAFAGAQRSLRDATYPVEVITADGVTTLPQVRTAVDALKNVPGTPSPGGSGVTFPRDTLVDGRRVSAYQENCQGRQPALIVSPITVRGLEGCSVIKYSGNAEWGQGAGAIINMRSRRIDQKPTPTSQAPSSDDAYRRALYGELGFNIGELLNVADGCAENERKAVSAGYTTSSCGLESGGKGISAGGGLSLKFTPKLGLDIGASYKTGYAASEAFNAKAPAFNVDFRLDATFDLRTVGLDITPRYRLNRSLSLAGRLDLSHYSGDSSYSDALTLRNQKIQGGDHRDSISGISIGYGARVLLDAWWCDEEDPATDLFVEFGWQNFRDGFEGGDGAGWPSTPKARRIVIGATHQFRILD